MATGSSKLRFNFLNGSEGWGRGGSRTPDFVSSTGDPDPGCYRMYLSHMVYNTGGTVADLGVPAGVTLKSMDVTMRINVEYINPTDTTGFIKFNTNYTGYNITLSPLLSYMGLGWMDFAGNIPMPFGGFATTQSLDFDLFIDATAVPNSPSVLVDSIELTFNYEYPTSPTFDACGKFAGVREADYRLYDHMAPATGKRFSFTTDGTDLNAAVSALQFELQENGGFGGGSMQFLGEWEKIGLTGTERLDVWLWDVPAYRGYLRIAQKDVASPETASPQLYGLVALMDEWQVEKKYAYGCPVDITTIFSDIANDFVKVTGRLPDIAIHAGYPTGATLKEYDGRGKSVSQAFNELSEYGSTVDWGVQMDYVTPVPGDILYMRPRSTTAAYVVPVGDNVEVITYPLDTHSIVNRLIIKGGTAAHQNLCPNGSFEELAPASDTAGNFLTNPSFEDGSTAWTLSSGATVQFPGNGGAFGDARTGTKWLEIDRLGEQAEQTVKIVTGGEYVASCWARRETGATSAFYELEMDAMRDSGYVEWTESSGSTDPGSDTYQYLEIRKDFNDLSNLVTKARIRVKALGGSAANDGILVDDLAIVTACGAGQTNWGVTSVGNALMEQVDWAHTSSPTPAYGAYAVSIEASAIASTSDYVELMTIEKDLISVKPSERYTMIIRANTNGAGSGSAFSFGARMIKSDGTVGTTVESGTQTAPLSAWNTFTIPITTASDTAYLQLFIRTRINSVPVYYDGVMLVQGAESSDDLASWWSGTSYEQTIDVTDGGLTGKLDSGISSSITTYGDHEQQANNSLVTTYDTAIDYAAGQFNAKAIPQIQGQLSLFAARQIIKQDGLVRFVNLPSAPDPLWPARATYSVTGEGIVAKVELGSKRPDLSSLLTLTAERARKGLV